MQRSILLLAGGLLASAMALGCSGERTIVRRETQTVIQPPPRVVERTTVETFPEPDEQTTVIKRKRTTEIQ